MPSRIDLIVAMKKDGKSFREIGKEFGISRQRAQQIYRDGTDSPGRKDIRYNPMYPDRKNPYYPEEYCGTFMVCEKCGESYEPLCSLNHICKEQNSYPQENESRKNGYEMKKSKYCRKSLKSLYKNLDRFMRDNSITRKELGKIIGADAVTVRKILKGEAKFIRIEGIIRLEELTGMKAKELFKR